MFISLLNTTGEYNRLDVSINTAMQCFLVATFNFRLEIFSLFLALSLRRLVPFGSETPNR